VRADGETIVALAPLAPGAGWYLSGHSEVSKNLIQSAVLRLVAQSPISNLAIDVFDPKMSARLAGLAPLRNMNDRVFPPPHSQADSFARRVEQIVANSASNAERVVASGARSLTELWRSDDTYEGTLTIVVALDYPYGVDRPTQEALSRLIELGPAAGAIVLIQEDASAPAAPDVIPSALRAKLFSITASETSVQIPGFPSHVVVAPDPAPEASVVEQILRGIRERALTDQGPEIALESLIAAAIDEPWSRQSIDAIEMTVGRAGRELLEVQLRSENPPHPNLLIGGAVGTGKSNLLLDLIYSSAIAHSPDELEMILLDFKRGLEFKRFDVDKNGEGWLPHVSVLSLESNQQFGVAVLEHVNDEMARRADLFKDGAGFSSINAYRRATAEVLPRLLVVIDEFHVLLDGDEQLTERAVALLEAIAKQGRAYGIHLVLASQTVSGISGLRTKGQGIFAQFPLRISLKNTSDESQAILAPHNTAAADLVHRGEVLVNRNFGNPASNERGIAALVSSDRFAQVQRELWERGHKARPLTFLGRQFAEWDFDALRALRPLSETTESLSLWIGRPVRVTAEPATITVRRDTAQAVAILGPDSEREPTVPSVVSGMVVSAAQQFEPGDSIVVLDGTSDRLPSWLEPAIAQAESRGIRTRFIPATACAAYLRDELGTRTRDSLGRVLAVVLGVQRIPGIDEIEPASAPPPPADSGDLLTLHMTPVAGSAPSGSARTALQQLARDGALRGVQLVGWWSSVPALSNDLGGSHAGIGCYITASLGQEDLKYITNTFAPHIDGHPRVGVVERNSATGLRTVVPFAAWNEGFGRDAGGEA
jgi:DNA segregation ATPase FtsK/SpoIIIE, S-DNA-T family